MKSCAPARLCIVVLAAGFSARLGPPKALVRVHGVSLLRRTLLALPVGCGIKVVVVVPPRSARLRDELRRAGRAGGPPPRGRPIAWVENRRRAEGLSSSIRRGLIFARCAAAALLLPVDLAHLKRTDLERLVQRWRAAPRRPVARRIGGADGADSAGGAGGGAGTPLILPRRMFGLAQGLRGDAGLKVRIDRLPRGQCALIDLPSAQFDVDTAPDLAKARAFRRARFGPADSRPPFR